MVRNRTTKSEYATNVATLTTTLSFAVDLINPVTSGRPGDDVSVSLADAPAEPVTNPSGFRLFFEVAEDSVTLHADGGDRFFDEQTIVTHGSLHTDDQPPDPEVVQVELTPTPAYQFAPGTTLLRGVVTDDPLPDGDGVGDATVSLADIPTKESSVDAPTTESGEYALRIPVSADRVVSGNGARWLDTPGGSQSPGSGNGPPGNGNGPPGNSNGPPGNGVDDEFEPPTHELTVTHSDHAETSAEIPIQAGTTTQHDVVFD